MYYAVPRRPGVRLTIAPLPGMIRAAKLFSDGCGSGSLSTRYDWRLNICPSTIIITNVSLYDHTPRLPFFIHPTSPRLSIFIQLVMGRVRVLATRVLSEGFITPPSAFVSVLEEPFLAATVMKLKLEPRFNKY
ncbi:hypothetical protein E2C01_060304 [Portunus trituberculatus]|uniref:Uncharacterized protein n=1 Tax=Portunus trituberculatus TaxID=210409 RepID=A0A5B7H8I6_PORTR|nr:hypothetical protein [Portunus trituberculatus]